MKLVPNGIVEVPAGTFEAFVARVRRTSRCFAFTIPASIVEAMQLKVGDLVEVAVRRIGEDEAREVYGYVPRRYLPCPQVTCPICGRTGSLIVTQRKKLRVMHLKKHGFSSRVIHYISRKAHPELYQLYCPAEERQRTKQVICPKCGRPGSLCKGVTRRGNKSYVYFTVYHGIVHGFEPHEYHYISSTEHPDFYEEMLKEVKQ